VPTATAQADRFYSLMEAMRKQQLFIALLIAHLRAADYDGDRDAIRAGARVTEWYRTVEERDPVAGLRADPRRAARDQVRCTEQFIV
jgi:hypothetical protein